MVAVLVVERQMVQMLQRTQVAVVVLADIMDLHGLLLVATAAQVLLSFVI